MTKTKHSTKAALGHFKKQGTVAKKKSLNFKFCNRTKLGDLIDVCWRICRCTRCI
jgi:large subunit ribosomal protein L3